MDIIDIMVISVFVAFIIGGVISGISIYKNKEADHV